MKKIILFLLLVLTVGLSACGSDDHHDEPTQAAFTRERTVSQVDGAERNAVTRAEQVIHRAETGIVVEDFDEAVEQVRASIRRFNGFIERSNISGEPGVLTGREGHFVLRIPTNHYDEMLEELPNLGIVRFLDTEAVNVAAQFVDINSQLNALRVQEARILELIERATELPDLLELEMHLGEIISDIERLTGERNRLDGQVAYSTLTIRLSEHVEAFANSGSVEGLGGTFMTSLRALRAFFAVLLRVFVALIPWLIVGGLIAWPAVKFGRRYKNWKTEKTMKAQAQRLAQITNAMNEAQLQAKQEEPSSSKQEEIENQQSEIME